MPTVNVTFVRPMIVKIYKLLVCTLVFASLFSDLSNIGIAQETSAVTTGGANSPAKTTEAEVTAEAAAPDKAIVLKSAAELIPDTTQGYVRIVNLPAFVERWNLTRLGVLGKDDRLKGFWDEQRIEIEKRFANAGWQLHFHVEDIYEIATGQAALAWISKTDPQKPFAIALVLDIAGKKKEAEKLLLRIDTELKERKATSQSEVYESVPITHYKLPRGPGEIVIRESLYAIAGDQLLASDELATLKGMIDSVNRKTSKSLADFSMFVASRAKLSTPPPGSGDFPDVEYYVRPIGLAKLLRAISGKPIASKTDALKVLENQGFSKLAAASGCVRIGLVDYDIYHDAFVLTETPLPSPVQILDFPNQAGVSIPSWVSGDASTFLSLAWNSKDAFWKVEPIVDEMAGQKGVFESVIDGIETDPVGPQINIRRNVLPFLTPEIYSIGDTVQPITPESRRSLIAIRINDPNGQLANVLERAMKNEPDAKPEDFKGYRIWKVTRSEEDDDIALESDDFGFGNKGAKPPTQKEEEKPLLSNWAITIYNPTPANPANGFLMFASHADMIKEAIERNKADAPSPLASEPDVARVLAAIKKIGTDKPSSIWQINRTDKAFQMQYELFRQDKLPQSKSMIATILDRLLRPKDEVKPVDQKVKGDRLPAFDQVREFLMPGGSRVHTETDGWAFTGFILAKP